jgi:hypothetical protein
MIYTHTHKPKPKRVAGDSAVVKEKNEGIRKTEKHLAWREASLNRERRTNELHKPRTVPQTASRA